MEKIDHKAYDLKKRDDIEVFSVFEESHTDIAKVNVAEDDWETAKEALEEMDYHVTSIEHLIDKEDNEEFARITVQATWVDNSE